MENKLDLDVTRVGTCLTMQLSKSQSLHQLFQHHERVLLPVLHVSDQYDVLAQAKIAIENGADGLMLCAWPASIAMMLHAITQIREAYPDCFVGVNFMKPPQELTGPIEADAVWFDEGVDGNGPSERLTTMLSKLDDLGFTGLRFGGFAFKGKKWIPDTSLPELGLTACTLLDVPTTSGQGTGVAMDLRRAQKVRDALGTQTRVAVASGVTVANATDYLPYFDIFLVGTGVETHKPHPIAHGPEAALKWAEMHQLVQQATEPQQSRKLVQCELDSKLCSVEPLSLQSGLNSEGLVSAWLDGGVFEQVEKAMWERLGSRFDIGDWSEAQYERDCSDYWCAVESSIGAAGTVNQGELDGDKIAALAAVIHG